MTLLSSSASSLVQMGGQTRATQVSFSVRIRVFSPVFVASGIDFCTDWRNMQCSGGWIGFSSGRWFERRSLLSLCGKLRTTDGRT